MYIFCLSHFFNKLTTGPALASAACLRNVRRAEEDVPQAVTERQISKKQIFLILSTASNVDLGAPNGGGARSPHTHGVASRF